MRSSFIVLFLMVSITAFGCTSAIISADASHSGNVLLWKHRDTSHHNNYIDTVKCADSCFDYLALFNAEDTLKREAWAGVNRAGFAIMNTVAGNLPQNSLSCIDREGFVMSAALNSCKTVPDFLRLLDSLPKPMGVRTNFGVADMEGRAAYVEASDYTYEVFYLIPDSVEFLIRTNFAKSGGKTGGYGYDRFENAKSVIGPCSQGEGITPELLTDFLSREYFLASTGKNYSTAQKRTVKDKGFIPRPSSSSSVVIELTPDGPVMWSMLGYPPASYMQVAVIDSVPEALKLNETTGRSDACDEALLLKSKMLKGGKILMPQAKRISGQMLKKSLSNYDAYRKKLK